MEDSQTVTRDAFDVALIEPADVRLFCYPAGDVRVRMQLRDELCYTDVQVARALPLSDPDHYLGLRDASDKDIGVIQDWHSLDEDSLSVVRPALERSYLLPKVLKVNVVTDKFGIVLWDVVTDHGARRFVVRNIRDNSVSLSPTRVLMTDVEGDRFEFPNIYGVGAKALEILLKVH
jgi:hypothetical protein